MMETAIHTDRTNQPAGAHSGAPASAVIVSASRLVQTGIRRTLDRIGLPVAGESSSLPMVMAAARRPNVIVAVIDLENGFEAETELDTFRALAVETGVIALCDSAVNSAAAMMAGAIVSLPRGASPQELALAADCAMWRRPLVEGAAVTEMISLARAGRVNQAARSVMRQRLSPREIDVLQLLAHGWGNGVIGASLHISPKTVKNHVASILSKLGIENRIQAAVIAVQAGLVTGEMVSNVDAVRAVIGARPHGASGR
jgi:DNA-binding NarL/FixJ family response regulator